MKLPDHITYDQLARALDVLGIDPKHTRGFSVIAYADDTEVTVIRYITDDAGRMTLINGEPEVCVTAIPVGRVKDDAPPTVTGEGQ